MNSAIKWIGIIAGGIVAGIITLYSAFSSGRKSGKAEIEKQNAEKSADTLERSIKAKPLTEQEKNEIFRD